MAYNVLKGVVEGSVDQHGDQEIEGRKVFTNTISASVFYDTDAGAPCATTKDVAITKINRGTKNSILTYDGHGEKQLTSHHNLLFDGETLTTKNIVASTLAGDASGLTNIPTNKFQTPISAQHLNLGAGLINIQDNLQIRTGQGICIEDDKVEISVNHESGLSFSNRRLCVDPTKAQAITTDGQNLSDNDVLLVADVSRGTLTSTSLSNLYDSYVKMKSPQPSGKLNEIQLKGNNGLTSTPNFSFDAKENRLKVDGKVNTGNLKVAGSLTCEGAVFANVKQVESETYEVQQGDYTLLCNAVKQSITIVMPPATNNVGRIIVIKKTNTDHYNLRSYPIAVKCNPGETIDFKDQITIKINYSTCTLQSDGDNWWVIGSKGN